MFKREKVHSGCDFVKISSGRTIDQSQTFYSPALFGNRRLGDTRTRSKNRYELFTYILHTTSTKGGGYIENFTVPGGA